jgi:HD-GYP domain-containing protein (c-di-GMP phosphodiesterase class II)
LNHQPYNANPESLDINSPSSAKQTLGKGGSLVDLPHPRVSSKFTDELALARKIYARLNAAATRLFQAIDEDSLPTLQPLMDPIRDVANSIKRNPNAFEWIAMTNPNDMSVKQHCINVCILALKFGHYIGLPDPINRQLGLAGMTFDLGKMLVSVEILRKTSRLNDIEMSVMQKHPEVGATILRAVKGITPEIINVCMKHHERLDGTGYPNQLKHEEIDLLSRIIAILDTYVAITAARHHSGYSTPGRALNELYELRHKAYDRELVETFIRSLGVYPVGTAIEMQTGEIGLVISNDGNNKLSPLVLMVLDAQKRPCNEENIVNLAKSRNELGRPRYTIRQAVNAELFDINPKDYFRDE